MKSSNFITSGVFKNPKDVSLVVINAKKTVEAAGDLAAAAVGGIIDDRYHCKKR
jgi:hypothetical protein